MRKRSFDLVVCLLTAPLWAPVIGLAAIVMWVVEGRPVFYLSRRRVCEDRSLRVIKFRTMVRNAAEIANRDTVPVGATRFLNISIDSPLYTRIGRIYERVQFTELPQLLHVITGKMSLIGNRPLPENVIASLRERYPDAEDRFLAKCGLTGPVQLIGREFLADDERLSIETEYCRAVRDGYTCMLDLAILFYTVMVVLQWHAPMSVADVRAMILRSRRRAARTKSGLFAEEAAAAQEAAA
jgi:lipopolysaccharide/colanic/teichoic acid biosynthesis glycosyltransferase